MTKQVASWRSKDVAGRLMLVVLACVLVASAVTATVLTVRTARDLAIEGCLTFVRG